MTKAQKIDSAKKLRVLVVDDNDASAKTTGWTVELLGYDVKVETDPFEAIKTAAIYLPDAVLLDIGLPRLNGYEVCKEMRKNKDLKNTVFIAQTGWGDDEHKEKTKEAGFSHHLVKPVDFDKWKEVLAGLAKS